MNTCGGKAVSNNSTDNFHADFEKTVDEVKKELDKKYPIIINGKEIYFDNCFTISPSDTRITVVEFSNVLPLSVLGNLVKYDVAELQHMEDKNGALN